MTRTRKLVLATSSALVLAGVGAALASGSGSSGNKASSSASQPANVSFAAKPRRPHSAFGFRLGPAFAGHAGPAMRGFAFGLGLKAASDYLGIPVSTLVSDLRAGKTLAQIADSTTGRSASGLIQYLVTKANSALDTAVKDGKLSQTQESAITANLTTRIAALVNGTAPKPMPLGPRGLGPHLRPGLVRDGLQAAATYLGVPVPTLVSDLRAGKTLADVANATSGKSVSGLIQYLVSKATSALDTAVKNGKLSQTQESAITANLTARITALVNGTLPMPAAPFHAGVRPGSGFGFGFGHHGRPGPPPSGGDHD
jgi:polyhydroxyalkanoate synthesis regulator phasin